MKNITTILSKLTSIKDERYISLKDCLQNRDLNKYEIPICLGKDTNGEIYIKDFVDIGNLLIAGMTSSGKSMLINSFINTILLTKDIEEVKFILIDPKQVELAPYNGISHLLYPVCQDLSVAIQLLDWCIEEIKKRKTDRKKKPFNDQPSFESPWNRAPKSNRSGRGDSRRSDSRRSDSRRSKNR